MSYWTVINKDGLPIEMSKELLKILEAKDWTKMKTKVAKDFVTEVYLSNEKGEFANFFIDWNLNVFDLIESKIDNEKIPLSKKDESYFLNQEFASVNGELFFIGISPCTEDCEKETQSKRKSEEAQGADDEFFIAIY